MQDFNGNLNSSFMAKLFNLSYFYDKRRFELYIFEFQSILNINKHLKCKNKKLNLQKAIDNRKKK